MELSAMKDALKKLQMELHCYHHAAGILYFDGDTVAPRASAQYRGEVMAFLSQKEYELITAPETGELLENLWAKKDELDEVTARIVELMREEVKETTCIPMEEVMAYSRLGVQSQSAWLKAKETNDYAHFEPYLAQVIDFKRRFAAYRNPDKPVYEVMLDSYEKGMNTQQLDAFFSALRTDLVPLIEQAKNLPAQPAFVSTPCSIASQRDFSDYLMKLLGLDEQRCAIAETEHPFTTSMNRYDVRITTHYHEDAFLSSMYSVIHEGGHAHYELGVGDEYQFSPVGSAASMAMHESQSRFYENIIGHHPAFLKFLAPKIREFFPQLADVSDEDFIFAANYVQPSLIRTEADQVTYPLHIMVRYELEKQLIGGTLSTKDLPEAWNRLYKEYLGVDVPSDTMGVLQDVHWPGGMFGYFPTYALGSAYASQILNAMERDLPVEELIARGELTPITEWLNGHIHHPGNLYTPGVLLEKATGEPFNPSYYVAHLQKVLRELQA